MKNKFFNKGEGVKHRSHGYKQVLSLVMTLVFLAGVVIAQVPTFAAEAEDHDSIIHVHNITVGKKSYDDVNINSATNMFSGKEKGTDNSANNSYIIYVGQTLDLSARVGTGYTFSVDTTNMADVSATSDFAKNKENGVLKATFLARTPGACTIQLENENAVEETFYITVKYPINVVTALGEYHKDTINEFLKGPSHPNKSMHITDPDGNALYVKNDHSGYKLCQYYMFPGNTVNLTAYVLKTEADSISFEVPSIYQEDVNINNKPDKEVIINGITFIKKTATVQALRPTEGELGSISEVYVTLGTEKFNIFVQDPTSLEGGDHYDIETQDGSTYIETTTSKHQDGTSSITRSEYQSHVSDITSSVVYTYNGKEYVEIGRLVKGDYARQKSDGTQDEFTSAYETTNNGNTDDYGTATSTVISRDDFSASEVSRVDFDIDLRLTLLRYTIERKKGNDTLYLVTWEAGAGETGTLTVTNKASDPIEFNVSAFDTKNGSTAIHSPFTLQPGGSKVFSGLDIGIYMVSGAMGNDTFIDTLADSRETSSVNNVIITMDEWDILDAYNKCPAHNGFDFTIRSLNEIAMPTGDLTLTKKVEPDSNTKDTFEFTITLAGQLPNGKDAKTITGTYGDVDFYNGVATVKLKANESVTAKYLPVGLTYTVKEKTVDGYTVSWSKTVDGTTVTGVAATKGTITAAEDKVTVTNTKNESSTDTSTTTTEATTETSTTTETTTTTNTTTSTTANPPDSPRTADDSPVGLWLILMLLSAVGSLGMAVNIFKK